MSRIIALDYGTKRTGIAVTDVLKIIAQALETVHTKDVLKYLEDYMNEEAVETIVVGYPVNLKSQETHATRHVKNFIKTLTKKFPETHIEMMDERFTSKLAMQTMIMAGAKKGQRRDKENLDKISAAIILQNYIDYKI